MTYDPDRPPDPKGWLTLDEDTRTRLVEEAHAKPPAWHPKIQNARLHAALHAVVENQAALGNPIQVRAALQRLMAKGMSRHEAVHEVATVASEHLFEIIKTKKRYDPEAYAAALDTLPRPHPEELA